MPDVNPGAPEERLHVVIGEPDPDGCPICRAHLARPGTTSLPDPDVGEILVQVLPLGEMLRCPCPLCAAERRSLPEG